MFVRGATMRTAGPTALNVGTILSLVNQGAVVAGGHDGGGTWASGGGERRGAVLPRQSRLPVCSARALRRSRLNVAGTGFGSDRCGPQAQSQR